MKVPLIPGFSRQQLKILLLLGLALTALYLWREYPLTRPDPSSGDIPAPIFVEVTGRAAQPGVHVFTHAPTLPEVAARAGGPPPRDASGICLASGTLVEITSEGDYRLSRMSGPRLRTLGLALDLNTATIEDLVALPGVGPTLARRIVAHREKIGPFHKVEDLLAVPGIGKQKLAQLRPFLTVAAAPEKPAPNLTE